MKPGRIADWAFAVSVLLIGVAFFLLVYRPQLRAIDATKRRIVATYGEISRSQEFMRGLEDLESYLRDFESALSGLDRLVPAKTGSGDRFSDITELAGRCGLHDSQVRPDSPVPNGSIVTHPIKANLLGTYAEVQRFLFEAEALERHTRVTRFTVRKMEPGQKNAPDPGMVTAEVELTTYSILPATGGSS